MRRLIRARGRVDGSDRGREHRPRQPDGGLRQLIRCRREQTGGDIEMARTIGARGQRRRNVGVDAVEIRRRLIGDDPLDDRGHLVAAARSGQAQRQHRPGIGRSRLRLRRDLEQRHRLRRTAALGQRKAFDREHVGALVGDVGRRRVGVDERGVAQLQPGRVVVRHREALLADGKWRDVDGLVEQPQPFGHAAGHHQ